MLQQAVKLSFSDCDGFKDLLKHEDAEITQIRRGSFINTVTLVPLEHMVFRYGTKTTPWIASGSATPGHVSLLMDLNYRVFPTVNGILQEGSPLVQLYGEGSEHCSVTAGEGDYAMIPIPNQILEGTLRGLGIGRMPVKPGNFAFLSPEVETTRMLMDTIESLCACAEESPAMFLSREVRRTAERELLTRLALVIGQAEAFRGIKNRVDRMNTFRKARAFLHEMADSTVYLAELSAAAEVPERTLRDIFQSILGVSPLRYLQLRRMRQVRHTLQQSSSNEHSVKEIALSRGFWELGRFAVEYKRLFGESPSQTLKK